MEPVRIIYHPAPGPTADGSIAEVPPVNLGTDRSFALAWIRRRLGISGKADEKLLRFRSEVVPLAATSAESAQVEVLSAFEPGINMPEVSEQQRAEIAAGLADSLADSLAAIPDLSDDWLNEKD